MTSNLTIATLLLVSLASLRAAEVTNRHCEYLSNPLGIDAAKPRLSWVIEERSQKSEVGGQRTEARGLRQTAYQILVASSEELLKKNKGDLWDSGKVESGQSVHVEYHERERGRN